MTGVRDGLIATFGSDTVRFPAPTCEWARFDVGQGRAYTGEPGESEYRRAYFDDARDRCAAMFATLESLGGPVSVAFFYVHHDPDRAKETAARVAVALGTEPANWSFDAVPLSPEAIEDLELSPGGPERDCWFSHELPFDADQYLRLANIIVWQDFPRSGEVYFHWTRLLNVESGVAIWAYDDRGAIVLATGEEMLQPFIDQFGDSMTARGSSRPSPAGSASWFDIWSPGLG